MDLRFFCTVDPRQFGGGTSSTSHESSFLFTSRICPRSAKCDVNLKWTFFWHVSTTSSIQLRYIPLARLDSSGRKIRRESTIAALLTEGQNTHSSLNQFSSRIGQEIIVPPPVQSPVFYFPVHLNLSPCAWKIWPKSRSCQRVDFWSLSPTRVQEGKRGHDAYNTSWAEEDLLRSRRWRNDVPHNLADCAISTKFVISERDEKLPSVRIDQRTVFICLHRSNIAHRWYSINSYFPRCRYGTPYDDCLVTPQCATRSDWLFVYFPYLILYNNPTLRYLPIIQVRDNLVLMLKICEGSCGIFPNPFCLYCKHHGKTNYACFDLKFIVVQRSW